MKKSILIAAAFVGLFSIAGCSSTQGNTAKQGEYFIQDKSKSVAWNVAAFAGYPGMFSDHQYTSTLGTGVTMASNSIVIHDGIPSLSPAGALTLGVGMALISDTTKLYPLNISSVVIEPIGKDETYQSSAVVKRAILHYMKIRAPKPNDPDQNFSAFLKSADINTVECKEYSSLLDTAGYSHECYLPAKPVYNQYVTAVRPATGDEFAGVWNIPRGNYAVLLLGGGTGSAFIPKSYDNMFKLVRNGSVIIYGDNVILPFASPREDGKRLIVKDGKAQYL